MEVAGMPDANKTDRSCQKCNVLPAMRSFLMDAIVLFAQQSNWNLDHCDVLFSGDGRRKWSKTLSLPLTCKAKTFRDPWQNKMIRKRVPFFRSASNFKRVGSIV